eukprot:242508-Chlamydomonas_euryale.AAC.1
MARAHGHGASTWTWREHMDVVQAYGRGTSSLLRMSNAWRAHKADFACAPQAVPVAMGQARHGLYEMLPLLPFPVSGPYLSVPALLTHVQLPLELIFYFYMSRDGPT